MDVENLAVACPSLPSVTNKWQWLVCCWQHLAAVDVDKCSQRLHGVAVPWVFMKFIEDLHAGTSDIQLGSVMCDSFFTSSSVLLSTYNKSSHITWISPDCLHTTLSSLLDNMLPWLQNSLNVSLHPTHGLLLLSMFFDPLSVMLKTSGNTPILLLTGLPLHRSTINTALWRGLDSALLRTIRGWTPFYVVVNDSATAAVTLQLWQKWLRKRTKSYFATSYQTTIMSYNSTCLSDRAHSTTLGHELTTKHW